MKNEELPFGGNNSFFILNSPFLIFIVPIGLVA